MPVKKTIRNTGRGRKKKHGKKSKAIVVANATSNRGKRKARFEKMDVDSRPSIAPLGSFGNPKRQASAAVQGQYASVSLPRQVIGGIAKVNNVRLKWARMSTFTLQPPPDGAVPKVRWTSFAGNSKNIAYPLAHVAYRTKNLGHCNRFHQWKMMYQKYRVVNSTISVTFTHIGHSGPSAGAAASNIYPTQAGQQPDIGQPPPVSYGQYTIASQVEGGVKPGTTDWLNTEGGHVEAGTVDSSGMLYKAGYLIPVTATDAGTAVPPITVGILPHQYDWNSTVDEGSMMNIGPKDLVSQLDSLQSIMESDETRWKTLYPGREVNITMTRKNRGMWKSKAIGDDHFVGLTGDVSLKPGGDPNHSGIQPIEPTAPWFWNVFAIQENNVQDFRSITLQARVQIEHEYEFFDPVASFNQMNDVPGPANQGLSQAEKSGDLPAHQAGTYQYRLRGNIRPLEEVPLVPPPSSPPPADEDDTNGNGDDGDGGNGDNGDGGNGDGDQSGDDGGA